MASGVVPDEVLESAMLVVSANAGFWPRAEALFADMLRRKRVTSVHAFNAYLSAMAGVGRVASAEAAFPEMERVGIRPDVHSFTAVMTAAFHGKEPEASRSGGATAKPAHASL